MNKKEELLNIISKLQEMYPNLNRIMITDIDNPETIIITSENRVKEITEELDIDIMEYVSEEDLDDLSDLTWGGFNDDDDDGGILQ